VVYEIPSVESFEKVISVLIQVKKWIGELKQYAEKGIIISIAGNKCDMESKRQIKKS
jgi:GTPase SAR1 family protein